MENNRLLIMDRPHGTWHHGEILVKPNDPKIRLCSHVAFTSFTNSLGAESEHVWVSYRQRTVLVSFEAKSREQRCILNCSEKLRHGESVEGSLIGGPQSFLIRNHVQ